MAEPADTIRHYEAFMKQGSSGSITAEGVALIRAAEYAKPEGERICSDPYAIRFIRSGLLARLRNQSPEKLAEERAAYDRMFPGQRNTILTRVRFFDDTIRDEIASGTRQIVIIGAGYDSRPYRLEGMQDTHVFEVDRRETQERKKTIVSRIFGSLPGHVTYLPFDLREGSLLSSLTEAGFGRNAKALFVMEGLLCYLPPALVHTLLEDIVWEAEPGSGILFDYHMQSLADGTDTSLIARNLRRHVASIGEPFLFGMPEYGVEEYLGGFGYRNIRNTGDSEYLCRLFPPCAGGRETTGLLRFCYAAV